MSVSMGSNTRSKSDWHALPPRLLIRVISVMVEFTRLRGGRGHRARQCSATGYALRGTLVHHRFEVPTQREPLYFGLTVCFQFENSESLLLD